MLKKQNGITLIALIVTIIVLLILAGVSISMIAGENGIATKAAASKTKTAEAGEEESVSMAVATALTEGKGTIETDAEGKIVSDEVKTVLNKELKAIGYEGAEITKLPTEIEMAYNTYLINEFGSVSIYVPGKILATNLDEIFTSEYKSKFGGSASPVPNNTAFLTYKSGDYSLKISTNCGDTMGQTFLIIVDYYKNESLIDSYTYRGPSMYFNDDGTIRGEDWCCHNYKHLPKGWVDYDNIVGSCSCGGYEGRSIYGSLSESDFPKFEGKWVIDEENSNDYGLQYLTNILIDG